MSVEDARSLGVQTGDEAWVSTEASKIKVPIECSDIPPQGTVVLPHGFGLVHEGKPYGVNVNELTKNTHRDRLTASPLHRYVPCRIAAARGCATVD